jgi:hypothetical protein
MHRDGTCRMRSCVRRRVALRVGACRIRVSGRRSAALDGSRTGERHRDEPALSLMASVLQEAPVMKSREFCLALLPFFLVVPSCSEDTKQDTSVSADAEQDVATGADAEPDTPESADVATDADACVAPQSWAYSSPGCGLDARPLCAGPYFDACVGYACSCEGKTIWNCGVSHEPFAYLGPCTDAGAPEAGAGPDSGDDADADGGDRWEDVATDAGVCVAPQSWAYSSPGCGLDARPLCAGPYFDACVGYACSCEGKTIWNCGVSHEPFAYLGPCTDASPH